MRFLLVLVAVVLCLHACKDDIPPDILDQGLVYTIDQSRDTILSLGQGVEAMIRANSFPKEEDQVKLRIEVVRTVQDALLAGLTTVTIDGQYLSSEAMVRIRKENGDVLQFSKDVSLQIDTDFPDSEMKLFNGASGDNGLVSWRVDRDRVVGIEVDSMNNLGRDLFLMECASCHDVSLRKKKTGPALLGVNSRRTRDWLYEFTTDSYEMIASGDPQAQELWQEWRPTIGCIVPISKDSFSAIYDWIEAVSIEAVNSNTNYIINPINVLGENGSIDGVIGYDTLYLNFGDSVHTKKRAAKRLMNRSPIHYLVEISRSRWINVDAFYRSDKLVTPLFFFDENGRSFKEETGIFVLFPEQSMVLPYVYDKDAGIWGLRNSRGKDSLALPLGDPYYVVAFSGVPLDEYVIEKHEVQVSNPPINLKLKKGTRAEYNKAVKEMLNEVD